MKALETEGAAADPAAADGAAPIDEAVPSREPAATVPPRAPPRVASPAGRTGPSTAELAEQMDRIEAAVLSLADAFGGLQRQVADLSASAAAEAAAATPVAPPSDSAVPVASAGLPTAAAWEARDGDEPSSYA